MFHWSAAAAAAAVAAANLSPSCRCRTLAMAAECLAGLDSSMPSSVNDEAPFWQVNAACQLITTCFRLCAHGSSPDMEERFWPFLKHVLRSGAPAQQFAVQQVQHGAAAAQLLCVSLAAETWALEAWQLSLLGRSMAAGDAATAVAQAHAPPALLLEWLRCTMASLRLLEQPSWKPGGQTCGLRYASS